MNTTDRGDALLFFAEHGGCAQLDVLMMSNEVVLGDVLSHKNTYRDTPLMLAVRGGHLREAKILLRKFWNEQMNVFNRWRHNVLMIATLSGKHDCIRLLLMTGSPEQLCTDSRCESIFHKIRDVGSALILMEQRLVQTGRVHHDDEQNSEIIDRTLLIAADAIGKPECDNREAVVTFIKLLLARGANLPMRGITMGENAYKAFMEVVKDSMTLLLVPSFINESIVALAHASDCYTRHQL